MRPIPVAALNRLVGDEPRIAAAAHPFGAGAPAGNARLILIGHAQSQTIERRGAGVGEVEDELVAVVQIAIAVDRLVMPDRQIALETGSGTGRTAFDGNRLDPMNDVLEAEMAAGRLR